MDCYLCRTQVKQTLAFLFTKGNPGKPVGAKNKLTISVRDAVLSTFNEIQKDKQVNLTQFAKDYPIEFYRIAAKLIPTDITASVKAEVKVIHGMVVT